MSSEIPSISAGFSAPSPITAPPDLASIPPGIDLEREILAEQERAGINDPSHFAYPTYAKAAIQRRENLTRSADELRIQLEDAKSLLAEAYEELKKVELLDERDQARERAEESAREQADLDSIGLMRARLGVA